MPEKRAYYAVTIIKGLCGAGVTYLAWWTASVAPDWSPFPDYRLPVLALFCLAVGVAWFGVTLGEKVSSNKRLVTLLARIVAPALLIVLLAILLPSGLAGRGWVLGAFVAANVTLAVLGAMLSQPAWSNLGNLVVSLVALGVMLVIVELAAPTAAKYIADAQHRNAVETALANARSPMSPEEMAAEDQVRQMRSPQSELIVSGGGPAWGEYTGWGTLTNSVLHYWMDGVYDVDVVYNSLGFRGPEISYEKPDDVYRIMIVGDSFIEAREVVYEDTVYAQLADLLSDQHTPDGKRIEVFGVGAVGWGTLQEYLYYHHEGYRFSPDLIIDAFYINDVSDNYPAQFYPDRNIDFAVSDDTNEVVLLDHAAAAVADRRAGARWLDAWPSWLAGTRTAALLRRVIDPPREAITLAGDLALWHPQNFIFARLPKIEGYDEAWRRTRRAYEIWAQEAQANGSRLAVLAIGFPEERVSELAATFVGSDDEPWVWDADLPYTRLADILAPIDVPLILTRDRYAEYARSVHLRSYEALFFVEDGHWNPAGHRLTAQIIAETLRDWGIVE